MTTTSQRLLTPIPSAVWGLQSMIERLQRRFGDVAPDEVAIVVEAEYRALAASATFEHYLPLLAEKAASERLQELARRAAA